MPIRFSKAIACSRAILALMLLASCGGPRGMGRTRGVDKSIQSYLAGPGKMQYLIMPQSFEGPAGDLVADITVRDSAQVIQWATLRFTLDVPGTNETIDTLWLVTDAGRGRAYPSPKLFLKEREGKLVHYRFETGIDPKEFLPFMRSQKRAIEVRRNGVRETYTQSARARKRFNTAAGQMLYP